MQVLEYDEQRARPRQSHEAASKRFEEAQPLIVGADGRKFRQRPGALRQLRQHQGERREPGRSDVERRHERQLPAQRLDQALIGKGFRESGCAVERATAGFFDRHHKLAYEPRFSDAGLATDEDDAAASHLRTAPRFVEPCDLALSSKERQRPGALGGTRFRRSFGQAIFLVAGDISLRDSLGDRDGLGHRVDAHLVAQPCGELAILADRSGRIAELIA